MKNTKYKKGSLKVSSKKRSMIVGALILVVLLIGSAYWFWYRNRGSGRVETPASSSTAENEINYQPPTEEDKQAVDETKKRIEQEQSQTPQTNSQGKRVVTPVITSGSVEGNSIEVRALVSGIVENGGNCSFTFTKGNSRVTKNTSGAADATTSRCQPLIFAKSELSAGDWTIVLRYTSAAAEGTSNEWKLTVQ